MTTFDALLKSVCADPGDDTPRLVLADYLDEHQPDLAAWAELIRKDVAMPMDRVGWADDEAVISLVTNRCSFKFFPGNTAFHWWRGFPTTVFSQHNTFLDIARALFRFPLERVVLTDREPYPAAIQTWSWVTVRNITRPVNRPDGTHYLIAPEFRHWLKPRNLKSTQLPHGRRVYRYPTADAAKADLSRAAVCYGRWLHGLKPLDPTPLEATS